MTDGNNNPYFDPDFWHPKGKNFEVIDWAKWDAKNPAPPKVYDPPQLKESAWSGARCIPVWWSHRSPFCQTCCIYDCLYKSCSTKPLTGHLSDDDLFLEMLEPAYASEAVPNQLRGAWWMRDNIAPETVLTFQGWAWKSDPLGKGPLGLGTLATNFTNDPTCAGFLYSFGVPGLFANIQIHPEGKWIALAFIRDPKDPERNVIWNWIYVVQEEDAFEKPDGTPIDYLRTGDMIRLTWDQDNLYECDNAKLNYMYHVQRVAHMEKDRLVKAQPAMDDLRRFARQDAEKQPMCCGRCSCNLSPAERAKLQVTQLSNKQVWARGPPPPSLKLLIVYEAFLLTNSNRNVACQSTHRLQSNIAECAKC